MPALYPNTKPYTAQDQLDDLVYGASDYPNPNEVMPTPGVAGGYSSMAPAPAPAAEPAAQYPPSSPPPAGANYVAEPQAAGPDPFTGDGGTWTETPQSGAVMPQSGRAPSTSFASTNYNANPLNATSNPSYIWGGAPEWDAINVGSNVGQWSNPQTLPWDSTAAPLEQPVVGPYTGPNHLSGPSGDINTMPSQRGFGASGIDEFQRQLSGRQIQPAPSPAADPRVTQLPSTGEPYRWETPSNQMGAATFTDRDIVQAARQPGGYNHGVRPEPATQSPDYNWAAAEPNSMSDRAIDKNGAALGPQRLYNPPPLSSELPTWTPPEQSSDFDTRLAQALADAPATGANVGEGWLGGWDGLTADSRPTGDWFSAGSQASQPGTAGSGIDEDTFYAGRDAELDRLATANTRTGINALRPDWGPNTSDFQRDLAAATAPTTATPRAGSTPAPAKQAPAMWVLAPDGGLADVNDAGSAIAGMGDTGLPRLGVLNLEADGSITLNDTVVPKASLDAAATRGEKAVALSNEEFDAIVAAGMISNGDGSALTPEQAEVWRSALVGTHMMAPKEWMPYVADGSQAPVTYTAEAPAAPVVADTSSGGGSNAASGGGYSRGSGYSRGGGSSRGGGGGGGDWYDGGSGSSYPPSMPDGMADFFGPDAFSSPIFDRMRGMMGSRRRGRRRRGGRVQMPMMGMHPGREMPSRDVNLTVPGPVVNDELARALAMRDR